ncbi:hypothetical protein ACLOJK_041580 [Asimina triloba]
MVMSDKPVIYQETNNDTLFGLDSPTHSVLSNLYNSSLSTRGKETSFETRLESYRESWEMAPLAAAFLLQKLSEILLQEASFLLCVTDKVRSIRNKLEWMSSFLKDVDGMPRENGRAKLWVS